MELLYNGHLGPEKHCVIQRFLLFKGYLIHTAIYPGSQKDSVLERFLLLGEFVIRGCSIRERYCIGVWLSSQVYMGALLYA